MTSARAAIYGRPAGRSGRVRGVRVRRATGAQVAALRLELLFGVRVPVRGGGGGAAVGASTTRAAALGLMPGGAAAGCVPPLRPRGHQRGRRRAALASAIFTNNIRATALAFAGGIFLGIGTAALLIYNGLLIGIVAGVLVELAPDRALLHLHPAPRGARVLVHPGQRRGRACGWGWRSSRRAARRVERRCARGAQRRRGRARHGRLPRHRRPHRGFVTPKGIGLVPALLVGLGLAAAYWTLVLTLGRRHCDPVSGV